MLEGGLEAKGSRLATPDYGECSSSTVELRVTAGGGGGGITGDGGERERGERGEKGERGGGGSQATGIYL